MSFFRTSLQAVVPVCSRSRLCEVNSLSATSLHLLFAAVPAATWTKEAVRVHSSEQNATAANDCNAP